MSKKLTLRIDVDTPLNLTARQVGELVYRLINVGLDDARQTIVRNAGDVVGAEMATSLNFTSIVACPVSSGADEGEQALKLGIAATNRCLVIVSGGVADYVYDDGVEVELFDWDNYRDETAEGRADMRVSAHFKDLAESVGVPVQRSALT
jgi:hypothetical protein